MLETLYGRNCIAEGSKQADFRNIVRSLAK
ncbi:hypothetical protein SAMN04515624_11347 [Eubacterium maltosivorans]|nr:hypothetical protein EUMA32_24240 [Eubacterium maltosivorans]SDP48642.1 hypothetical protein SAMN04515624_11347 [Eubacterium maltosivorans]